MAIARGFAFLPRPGRSPRALALAGALSVFATLYGPLAAGPARAQDAGIFNPGATAVTGFSGTVVPGIEAGIPPGVDPVDETFIDTTRATLRVFDLPALGGPAQGQPVNPPPPFEVTAGQIGQVFAVTYDDGVREGEASGVPNLYAGATALHGIQIVTPDEDGDGRPERQRRGTPGATFMEGQFGVENGGGPGTIWKVDGLTGAVSRFADIETNSGPGIGDVSFDRDHRQFFASDLDSGLIHRIDAEGNLLDSFDHGLAGRPARDLDPVEDDGSVMDIKAPVFDTEDPETWGFTQDERRVWALAYRDGRLYYSVGEKAEIWSVGIDQSGGFAGDARWELTVKADRDYAVTDIAFDDRGRMYLAQRGPLENRYDYSRFADSGKGMVLRYVREMPDDPETESIWVEEPDEYAVGFPEGHRQTAGGLDLQYGYDEEGNFDGVCTATLVKTGDRLRDNPALMDRLAPGGPADVNGIQLTPIDLVRPRNEPPFGSWFVDFDGTFEDPSAEGHVGDVEVWRPCEGERAEPILEDYPAFASEDVLIVLRLPPCEDGQSRAGRKCRDREPELKVRKRAAAKRCTPAGGCDFVIRVTNEGDAPFHGKIVLDEVTLPAGATLTSGPNPPWSCVGGSPLTCVHPVTTLDPGEWVDLKLGFAPPAGFKGRVFRNCVVLNPRENDRKAFGRTHEDRACARIPVCQRGDNDRLCQPPPRKVDLLLKKRARSAACTADGVCTFVIDIVNAGSTTFSGPLTVVDSFADAPASSTFGPSPPWNCVNEGPGTVRCEHPGIVLPPGGSTAIGVKAVMPANHDKQFVTNCAEVKAVDNETNLANNRACASARFRNPEKERPRLTVEKTGDSECRTGQPCSFEITITNENDTAFSGPMRIGDAIGIDGQGRLEGVPISQIMPPLGCDEEPTTLPLSCVANLSLGPHESRAHKVVVVIPDDAVAGTDGKVSGENCVGVVSPNTPVIGGGGSAPLSNAGGKAYACHPFTIAKEEKQQCSQGFVMNTAGKCVCPKGTTFRNGRCTPSKAPDPKPEEPRQCVLLKGQIRTRTGECVCPRDTRLVNGACVIVEVEPEPPVRACKLLPGQIRTRSGDCVCPRGTELKGKRCVPIRTVEECKIRGQVHNKRGQCVCPRGTELVRGACRKPSVQECPEGTVLKGRRCVPEVRQCPEGTLLKGKRCVPVVNRQCPKGMVGKFPDCFPKRNPRPTIEIAPDLLDNLRPRRPRGERGDRPRDDQGGPILKRRLQQN